MSKPPPPPLPDLDWSDLPELKELPWKELKKVPNQTGWWRCSVAGCPHKKLVRDFGIFPEVYCHRAWVNVLDRHFLCWVHWPEYQRAKNGGQPVTWQLKPMGLIESEARTMFPFNYWKNQAQADQHKQQNPNAPTHEPTTYEPGDPV